MAAFTLLLAACGGGGDKPAARQAAHPKTNGPAPASTDADAVAAVLQSSGAPLAQLQFVLAAKPVVGAPFHLKLIATAATPVPGLRFTTDSPGLVADPATGALPLAEAHATASQDLTITAQQAGLAELTVHLAGEADGPETVYAVPVLVQAVGVVTSDEPDPAAAADHANPQH